MTTNLDIKNGEFFEAATEALYQSKIEELQAQLATAVEALERYANESNYSAQGLTIGGVAREALARIRKGKP